MLRYTVVISVISVYINSQTHYTDEDKKKKIHRGGYICIRN